jgi:hypothetical protein
MIYQPEIQASFVTPSREAFVKACAILANGLDMPRHQSLVISVQGSMDVGKSLVADAMIGALSDDMSPYAIKADNKMLFEKKPAQAAAFPVRGQTTIAGRKTHVHFVRSEMDYDEVSMWLVRHGGDNPAIIFYGGSNHLPFHKSNIQIGLHNRYGECSEDHLKWHRQWDVLISPERLNYDSILRTVGRLKAIGEGQSYRFYHGQRMPTP